MKREVLIELGICGLVLVIIMVDAVSFALAVRAQQLSPLRIGMLLGIVLFVVILMRYSNTVEDATIRSMAEIYRSMLDNLPVGVYRAKSNGELLEANRTFVRMLGYSDLAEIKKVNLKNVFVRESDRVGLLEKLRSTTVFAEFQLRRKNEETIWVRDYPKATLALTGDVDYMDGVIVQTYGIEAIVRDITEHRKLEIMKDQFISAVTHELRTPLVSIKGYVDYVLAEDQNTPLEDVRPSIEVLKRNANRLLELTNDLLDIHRMESGKLQLKLQDVDVRDLLRKCVDEIQPLLDQKFQHLHLQIPNGPLTVQADPLRLDQVIINLLNNATKFTAEDGHITIQVKEVNKSGGLEISVKDTGIGISPQDLIRVFEPFAAIDKPTYYKGTGLGLSLSKMLVGAHGGSISASSPGRNQGATFTFTLPRKRMVVVNG
jgi:PAS domain S-box-containing protein